jgi:hypothetical protein
MLVMAQSRANPQNNLERHWIFPVRRVQNRGLRVEGKVCAHGQLPEPAQDDVARRTKCVRSNTEARKQRIPGNNSSLVDQFRPRERIIAQITVQIAAPYVLVHASPHSLLCCVCSSYLGQERPEPRPALQRKVPTGRLRRHRKSKPARDTPHARNNHARRIELLMVVMKKTAAVEPKHRR